MAVSNEIFRAQLTIDLKQVDTAISGLDNLAQSAEKAVVALQRLSDVKIDLDLGEAGFDDLEEKAEKATEGILDKFKDLKNKLVGHSIIPEMIAEIEAEFDRIGDAATPQIEELKRKFESLKMAAEAAISGMTQETHKYDIQKLVKDVIQARGELDQVSLDDMFAGINKNVETAEDGLKRVESALGSFQNEVRQTGQTIQENMVMDELVSRWDTVSGIAQESIDQLNRPLRNLRDGLSLATAEGGNFALGIRQAFFGIGEATGIVARGLDFIGGRFNELSRAQNKYAKQTLRINESIQNFTATMRDQVDILKEVGDKEGVQASKLNEVDSQVKRVERAYKDMQTTITAGGKPTEQQMARIQVEVRELEQTFRRLVAQGIIPAGSQTERMVQQMVAGVRTQGNATEQMVARVKVLRKEIAEAEKKQEEKNKTDKESANIFKRITINIGDFLHITKRTTNEVNNLGNEMQDLNQAASRTNQVMSTAKGAFLGFIGAAAAITGIRYAFDSLRYVIGGVAREFYEVNQVAQNFEITLASMLRGSAVEAAGETEAVVTGALDFIKKAVADTPFELADAMESFQRLIVAGLDPQSWMVPIADAAAIMQKPMDQLIGAFQRLVVGDTGQALAMMRDFGINVNAASAFVETATGRILDFDEAAALAGLTAEEITAKGYQELTLEFEKSGQLATDTSTAMKVLNGYLTQNAAIAGTAAARSQSLSGVISNLKDFVSNLFIEMGKPVIQLFTGAGIELLSVLNELTPTLNLMASQIGTWLANAVQNAITFVRDFKDNFQGVIDTVQTVVAFVASVFSGDWNNAWNIFADAIVSGIDTAIDLLDGLVQGAFDWGVSFVIEIANGIIDSASSFLVDALNYVGDMISSFLAPGSPPEQGPLSTIDKWGAELAQLFGSSLGEIDTDDFGDALDDIHELAVESGQQLPAEFFGSFTQANYGNILASARKQMYRMVQGLPQFNMDDVLGGLSGADFSFIKTALDPIKEFFKESMGKEGLKPFLHVRDTMAALVAEMNQTGEVNQDLWRSIEQQLGEQNKEMLGLIKAQLELEGIKKRVADATARGFIPAELKKELAQAEEKVEREQLLANWQKETNDLQQEFLKGLDKAASAMNKAASAAKGATKAQTKQFESLADWYAREKALIEEKYQLGILSEEEYVKALLNLEKQYVDRALKEGIPAGLQAHVDAIAELEKRLEGFKAATGQAARGLEIPSPADILAPFADTIEESITEIGTTFGQKFFAGFKAEIPRSMPEIMATIWQSLTQGLSDIFSKLTGFVQANVTPENFAIFSLISGAIASIAVSPVLSFLGRFVTLLAGAGGAGGGLLGTLVGLGGTLLKFGVIGGIIVTILLNWETIMETLGPLVSDLMGTVSTFAQTVLAGFIEKLGGAEAATALFHDALATLTEIGTLVMEAIMQIPTMILEGDWQGIGDILLNLLTTMFEFVGTNLLPIVSALFGSLADAIYQALPPGIIEAIEKVREAVVGFFKEGTVGGELVLLFEQLGATLLELGKIVGPVVIAVLGAIGTIIVTLGQTVGDILPYIGGILAGAIRTIRGLLQIVEGWVQIVVGIFQLLTGNTEKANETLKEGFTNWTSGFATAFSGIALIVENALAGVIAAVISFVGNLLENVTFISMLLGDEPRQWVLKFIEFKENALVAIREFSIQAREFIVELTNKVIEFFTDLFNKLIGRSIIVDMVDGILGEIVRLKDTFLGYINELVTNLLGKALEFISIGLQFVTSLQEGLSNGWSGLIENVSTVFNSIKDVMLSSLDNLILAVAEKGLAFLDIGVQFVDSLQQGIAGAWEGLTTFVTGKIEQLFGPILDTMAKIPGLLDPAQLKEAGINMVEGVRDGISDQWGQVQTVFADKTQELEQPVEDTKNNIVGIFTNLYDSVVGNSIIPEMTTAIVLNVDTMNATLLANLTAFSQSWLQTWKRTLDSTLRMWRNFVDQVANLARQLYDILNEVLSAIVRLFREWESAVSDVLEKLEKLPESLEKIGEHVETIEKMADAFGKLEEAIDDAVKRAEDLVSYLEQVRDLQSSVGDVGNGGGGGPPPAQTGIWRVGKTSAWTLHAGETVLPPDVASNFRSLVSSLRSTGIGAHNLALPNIGAPAIAGNADTTKQYIFGQGAFAGAFPNVRSGRDADSFVEQLDRLTEHASLKGSVVS